MSKLLFNEPPLCVSPSLATVVGLNEALLLQQIHYWLDPRINKNCINGMHWVYNSYKDWQRQFPFFTEITIRRTIKKLEEMKLLIADNFNTKRSDNTKWYTINYEALQSLEIRSEVNLSRPDQNDQAITSKQSRGLIKMSRRPDQSDQVLYSDTKNNTKTSTNTLPKTKGGEGIRMLSKESMEREMLLIWNEVADNAISRDTSPKRAKELQRVLTEYFNNNIDEWKLFCKTIASNDFLMGRTTKSTWKASLSWAIKPDSIEKIREGSYEKGKGAQPQAITESLDADSSFYYKPARAGAKHRVEGRQRIIT